MNGKTAATLSALTPEHLPALVVAPKRVAENVWGEELALWRPDLTFAVAAGSPSQRLDAVRRSADVTILGRDNLRDITPQSLRGSWRTLILDESSGFKNRSTIRWRAAKALAHHPNTKHCWLLTGTPSPNGLLDLWAQIYLLDKGERLYDGIGKYRARYFTPGRQLANGTITEWNIRPGADKQIHSLVDDICLSMETEGRVELPEVTFNNVTVPLPAKVKRIYQELKKDLVASIELIDDPGSMTITAGSAGVLSNKLSQVSAGFLYPDADDLDHRDGEYTILHTEKLLALQEIIEGTGSPVLVFYRYRAEKEQIAAFKPLQGLVHTVDEPGVLQRWNRREVPVLLAHPASAGHGLNLQHGGSTIVWTSPTWSLEEYLQANKRLLRQGQKHPVKIHHLIGEGTVDTAVLQRLSERKTIQDALLTHLEAA